ncbi:MAG TPA: hypothetical protein V6C86_16795 [Oculatellaceae cyanobacterium]
MGNKKKPETVVVYRSSVTGQFVNKRFAEKHQATTEKQHIKKTPTQTKQS